MNIHFRNSDPRYCGNTDQSRQVTSDPRKVNCPGCKRPVSIADQQLINWRSAVVDGCTILGFWQWLDLHEEDGEDDPRTTEERRRETVEDVEEMHRLRKLKVKSI